MKHTLTLLTALLSRRWPSLPNGQPHITTRGRKWNSS